MTKDEHTRVTPDEWLVRLIWRDFIRVGTPPVIHARAFLPRPTEVDGISVFRAACFPDPSDALRVIAPDKRGKYAIALVSVELVVSLNLTVRPDPIETVPGHAVLVELNITATTDDPVRSLAIQSELAKAAGERIVSMPTT